MSEEKTKRVFIDTYNYYQVPPNLFGSNPNNKQGIAAFSDYFSAGALQVFIHFHTLLLTIICNANTLQEFDSYFSINPENVTSNGPNCLIESCDQFESDLDVQV